MGTVNILPAATLVTADSDVTYPCSSPKYGAVVPDVAIADRFGGLAAAQKDLRNVGFIHQRVVIRGKQNSKTFCEVTKTDPGPDYRRDTRKTITIYATCKKP